MVIEFIAVITLYSAVDNAINLAGEFIKNIYIIQATDWGRWHALHQIQRNVSESRNYRRVNIVIFDLNRIFVISISVAVGPVHLSGRKTFLVLVAIKP